MFLGRKAPSKKGRKEAAQSPKSRYFKPFEFFDHHGVGGSQTLNFAEIVGDGAGAGISDRYYPARERTWTKSGQKWVTQLALDGVFNILKEFWPNINHAVFHSKY